MFWMLLTLNPIKKITEMAVKITGLAEPDYTAPSDNFSISFFKLCHDLLTLSVN